MSLARERGVKEKTSRQAGRQAGRQKGKRPIFLRLAIPFILTVSDTHHGDVVDLPDAPDVDIDPDEGRSVSVVDSHRTNSRVVSAQSNDGVEDSFFDSTEVRFAPVRREAHVDEKSTQIRAKTESD